MAQLTERSLLTPKDLGSKPMKIEKRPVILIQ